MVSSGYRIVLALHIVSVISWMAGILYLYRLFVYHAMEKETVVKERFKVMEDKLYRIIASPAMIASLVFGLIMLAMNPSLFSEGWLHAKLFLVVCLIGATHYGKKCMRELGNGTSKREHKFFRIMNEVPTLLMILIVFLVILRPF